MAGPRPRRSGAGVRAVPRRPARPALRPAAAEWANDLAALLAPRTDPLTARALVALMDGICLHVLLTGGSYDEEYAREALARVIP